MSEDRDRDRLSVLGGLAALSLDALSSVAYGPEAIVVVLWLGGAGALHFTLPITLAITLLLAVLTLSYRQVIAAFPQGGGAYGVSKAHLGRSASLVAAASLIVDYVLNVAVAITAGVAALTSAFRALYPDTVWLCLGVLAVITAINLRGIAESARLFIVPTLVFIVAILAVIVVGLVRGHPESVVHEPATAVPHLETVGVLLILRAFANGCSALTGVEAIANAVPSFRKPRVKNAQWTEVCLGFILGTMLVGLAVLIERFHIHPVDGVTVLSQVTEGSFGRGFVYYVVQFATVVLLALAANTSFGGMPVLAQLLARDNNLPHLFALRAVRQVHRYGILFLTVTAAALIIGADGKQNTLVPLFAIGVFVGFTLSQAGMVRHWWLNQPRGWQARAALNGFGALLTCVAAIIVAFSKFTEGGWLIVVIIPLLVLLMMVIHRAYARIGEALQLDRTPEPPSRRRPALVIVPIGAVSALTSKAISAALSLGDTVIALRVVHPDDEEDNRRFVEAWDRWACGVELVMVNDDRRRLVEPVVHYVKQLDHPYVFVLIPEIEPDRVWKRILQNQRGGVLAHALRQHTDAVICRFRFRLKELPEAERDRRRVEAGP